MIASGRQGRLSRPWLWLPSRVAHDCAPYLLPCVTAMTPQVNPHWRPLEYQNLKFSNPLGLAGGVDKTGAQLSSWKKLGAGFLEVGTVTPEPQAPNPGRIMARDISQQALWNKMGFPNAGVRVLVNKLKHFDKSGTPLFINIGKNRWTENSKAYLDYAFCIKELHSYADAFVVNVSSPNTKGLRDLLGEEELKQFLESLFNEICQLREDKVFLLKLSPDMDEETLLMALEASSNFVDGWILTNTTKQRYPHSPFPEKEGGVSGAPLKELSKNALKIAARFKLNHADKLLISVGGISSPEEIVERLDMGADLVQFYSGLVFGGPFFFQKNLKILRKA